jgi:hypothetical protein
VIVKFLSAKRVKIVRQLAEEMELYWQYTCVGVISGNEEIAESMYRKVKTLEQQLFDNLTANGFTTSGR